MLTGRQLRAARAYLGLTISELADEVKVARGTLWQIEKGAGWTRPATLETIIAGLAKRGITVARDGSLRGLEP